MFGENYGYQSHVTATMRKHLAEIADEAQRLLGHEPKAILDIGCNDGTLLDLVRGKRKVGIDPCAPIQSKSYERVWGRPEFHHGFYPEYGVNGFFDLIFSIACFYDSADPVAFARAVREDLREDGLWCCEVADVGALLNGAWDGICHEHVCYYGLKTFRRACMEAGLWPFTSFATACNGGSLCFYARKEEWKERMIPGVLTPVAIDLPTFRNRVETSRHAIDAYLLRCAEEGKTVHLLGASTKANTWLQYCEVSPPFIQAASERDPRKVGRRTPGTNIPILSEEESRARKPDVYIVGPWHFRNEIIEREQEFLKRGGTLVFPLPTLEEYRL
jgi:hypothetical protein